MERRIKKDIHARTHSILTRTKGKKRKQFNKQFNHSFSIQKSDCNFLLLFWRRLKVARRIELNKGQQQKLATINRTESKILKIYLYNLFIKKKRWPQPINGEISTTMYKWRASRWRQSKEKNDALNVCPFHNRNGDSQHSQCTKHYCWSFFHFSIEASNDDYDEPNIDISRGNLKLKILKN